MYKTFLTRHPLFSPFLAGCKGGEPRKGLPRSSTDDTPEESYGLYRARLLCDNGLYTYVHQGRARAPVLAVRKRASSSHTCLKHNARGNFSFDIAGTFHTKPEKKTEVLCWLLLRKVE